MHTENDSASVLCRLLSDTLRDQEAQTRLLMKQARLAQEKGKQFLQESADKRKREKAEVDEQHRAHLDRRIKAMISLKKNIESSQVSVLYSSQFL